MKDIVQVVAPAICTQNARSAFTQEDWCRPVSKSQTLFRPQQSLLCGLVGEPGRYLLLLRLDGWASFAGLPSGDCKSAAFRTVRISQASGLMHLFMKISST